MCCNYASSVATSCTLRIAVSVEHVNITTNCRILHRKLLASRTSAYLLLNTFRSRANPQTRLTNLNPKLLSTLIPAFQVSAQSATSPSRVLAKPGVFPIEPQSGGVASWKVIGCGRSNDGPPGLCWAPTIVACLPSRQNRRMCDISWTLHARFQGC